VNCLIEHIPLPVAIIGGLGIIDIAWRLRGIRGAAGGLAALAALFILREV